MRVKVPCEQADYISVITEEKEIPAAAGKCIKPTKEEQHQEQHDDESTTRLEGTAILSDGAGRKNADQATNDLISKLLNTGFHKESNEHEARSTMKLTQRLMRKHNISQAPLLKERQSSNQLHRDAHGEILKGAMVHVNIVNRQTGKPSLLARCMDPFVAVVAKNVNVKSYKSHARGRKCAITFYGSYANAPLARYAFKVAAERILQMTPQFTPKKSFSRRTNTKSARLSYSMGMVEALTKEVEENIRKEKGQHFQKLGHARWAAARGEPYKERDDNHDEYEDCGDDDNKDTEVSTNQSSMNVSGKFPTAITSDRVSSIIPAMLVPPEELPYSPKRSSISADNAPKRVYPYGKTAVMGTKFLPIFCIFLVFVQSFVFVLPQTNAWNNIQTSVRYYHLGNCKQHPLHKTLLFATSSSKLKRTTASGSSKQPLVQRLSQAAKRAKKSLEQEKTGSNDVDLNVTSGGSTRTSTSTTSKSRKLSMLATSDASKPAKLGSLQGLTAAIEAKLAKSQRESLNSPMRDAMAEVLKHNEEFLPRDDAVKRVAILLTKPMQNDRVTLEHAIRVRRLVHSMLHDGYQPNVICFVGGVSPGNLVADSDASYLFFQELCAAQKIPVYGIDIHLVKGSVEDGALEQISYFLRETCTPLWNRELQKEKGNSELLHVHFTLISSEYELCQLNDIHNQSPGRSKLRALSEWSSRGYETSWTYLYSTTILPADESDDIQIMFRSKTYRSGQELIPVLQHLRGVAENREFFQSEAYRVLVAVRRSIVKDMELLYHRPKNQLKSEEEALAEQRQQQQQPKLPQQQPIDVTLEAALLSLGRCLDIVRQGRSTRVLPTSDWKLAAVLLEKAISMIIRVCDTDHPLDPCEWGKMGD